MRSIISALRGSQAAVTCRLHQSRTPVAVAPAAIQHHCSRQHPSCCWLKQQRRSISTSPTTLSTADSFHGVSLPAQKEGTRTKIQEAEVVDSEEGRRRTRELIKEVTRAKMLAHSIVDHGSGEDNDASNGEEVANSNNKLGPYERRLHRLEEVQSRHQDIIKEDELMAYAQSCMELGELHYELGHMENSQEQYMEALKQLLNGNGEDDYEDGKIQMLIAQCMHSLGAIHARCGEFDEASRWYKESLKKKSDMVMDNESTSSTIVADDDGTTESISYRYELGKTYNGMAALEIMKGGDVQWDKAMSLFQEAEKNYLHGYEQEMPTEGGKQEAHNPLAATKVATTNVTKEALQKMSPRHVESLINVRSNMGELLIQRERYESAADMFQLALDMARMALENAYDNSGASLLSEPGIMSSYDTDGPSPDEQRNTIVELLVKIADAFVSAKKYDLAAASYEQALDSHIHFRGWSKEYDDGTSDNDMQSSNQKTVLPAISITDDPTQVNYDLNDATKMEGAIRTNLAHALAQIGQNDISQKQFEAALTIKRHIGGDFHMEVAHTLMGLGALAGGPLRDFTKALNCFKEALYIYRTNFEECSRAHDETGNNGSTQIFFGDEDAEEIDGHIQNATKNIGLIEAALVKDKDGVSKRRKRKT